MNPILIIVIVAALLTIVWIIASDRAYKLGYAHALEDLEALSLAVKKEMEKRKINED